MKNAKLLLSLFIIALLAVGFVTGCGSDSDDDNGTDTGNVTGTVTDNNGNAVDGATCSVTTTETKAVYSDTSDADGLFLITGVPTGTWPLSITKTGYQSVSVNVTIGSGSTTEVPTSSTVVTPTTGTGAVAGIVTDAATQNAIDGVTVAIGSTTATTTATGAYNLSGITAGAQTISASKSTYENYSSTVTVVADSTVTKNIEMTSSAPEPGKGHVKGSVVDENGNGIASVTVTAGTTTTTTDTNGEYALMNLTPGAATLSFSKTGYDNASVNVTVVADQVVTASTVTMTTGPTTGTTVLCSVPRTTENAAKTSNGGTCSDNGAYVSFIADQQLLATHITTGTHVYMFSRSSGTVTMCDVDPSGLEGTLAGAATAATSAFISGDASLIAFATPADNLLGSGNDANGTSDIFTYHRTTGKVSRVSVDYSNALIGGYVNDTQTTGGVSLNPVLSQDGGYLAYDSTAKNVVAPGFINDNAAVHATTNVFRVKLTAGADGAVAASSSLLISGRQLDGQECDPADWGGAGNERVSQNPWISRDGRFVTYLSNAFPGAAYAGAGVGTAGDTLININAAYRDAAADRDVALCDTTNTVQTWTSFVSINSTGLHQVTGGNQCSAPTVTDDGTKVAFQNADGAALWVTGNDAFTDVWVKNMSNGNLQRISNAASGARGNSANPMISRDGTLVIFDSAGTGFVQNDTNASIDCFVWKAADGSFARVNLSSNNEQTDNTAGVGSFGPFLSGDNNYVTFTSIAKNLTSNVYFTPATQDVYLRKFQ